MIDELRAFLLRGNLLDLAVAFILGAAFTAVVNAFSEGVITAAIAAIFGRPDFDSIVIPLGRGEILIGTFLTAVANFAIVGVALFLLVKAVARLQGPGPEADSPVPSDEVVLLAEIRDLLRDPAGGGA